jgi:hypothetical protein
MKKIGMWLFASLLVACNSKSKVSDQGTVADNEEQITEVAVKPAVSDEVKHFTSPDLAFNMLHSKVDYVVTTTYAAEKKGEEIAQGAILSVDTLQFDSEGRMVYKSNINNDERTWYTSAVEKYTYTANGELKGATLVRSINNDKLKYNMKVKRNAKGYITLITYTYTPMGGENDFSVEYEWKDGVLKSYNTGYWESNDGSNYTYDDKGFVSEERFTYGDTDGGSTRIYKYEYTAQDECDNWTKCSVQEETTYESYEGPDGTSVKDKPIYKNYIKERQIVYQK